jgi:hypothetical protein
VSTYTLHAHCDVGCNGNVSAMLTLAGGDPLHFSESDFVSFTLRSTAGDFVLDNSSPYLVAQGGGFLGPETIFIEQNAYRPNDSYPLWQFVSAPGYWQFESGPENWTCADNPCTTSTLGGVRMAGDSWQFIPPGVPEPATAALLSAALLLAMAWRLVCAR